MGRMIDVDKLGLTDFEIVMCSGDYKEALKMLIEKIENAPTVDAVEVVRCKDCKYSEPSVYPQAVNCTVLSKAIREWVEGYGCPATDLIMTVFEDHYCSWGERKEDEVHKREGHREGK